MSTFTAKKVSLDVMRECQEINCSCFTNKGYFIQCKNTHSDSMIFVCEECFNTYYKSKATIGSFDEKKYQHSINKQRHFNNKPSSIHRFIIHFHNVIRVARASCIIISMLLIIVLLFFNEQPQLRTEYSSPDIRLDINSNARGLENISAQFQSVSDRIKSIVEHNGGTENDQ